MKIRVDGIFKGQAAHLEWEDGVLTGSSYEVIERALAEADINIRHPFPTPDGFRGLDDWMSEPRGFVICAKMALDNPSTDWVDSAMEGVILMR